MQLTERDERMIEWLAIVRLVDMDGLRWALGGLSGAGTPVSTRKAQQWVARCASVGLVDRARPTFRDGSVVWATHQAIGKVPPNLYRQTTRHEVAVAAVAARYLCHGWSWERDRRPAGPRDHQADGVARRGDVVELVEVELTPKRRPRYKTIMDSHTWRLAREGVSRVVYFTTVDAGRSVNDHADQFVHRTERALIATHVSFDRRGTWDGDEEVIWGTPVEIPGRLPGLELLTPTSQSAASEDGAVTPRGAADFASEIDALEESWSRGRGGPSPTGEGMRV